ncbi:unnamed protein product, partial [Durusdinium trenchii]
LYRDSKARKDFTMFSAAGKTGTLRLPKTLKKARMRRKREHQYAHYQQEEENMLKAKQ